MDRAELMTLSAQSAFWPSVRGSAWRTALTLRRSPMVWYTAIAAPLAFFVGIYLATNRTYAANGLDANVYVSTGLVVQILAYCGISSALGMSADLRAGFFSRIRSMPVSIGAFLCGRAMVEVFRNVVALTVAVVVVDAFRPVDVPWAALSLAIAVCSCCAVGTALLYAAAMMLSSNEVVGNAIANCLAMPLVFFSTAFVPASVFPSSVRPVVEWSPFSPVADYLRSAYAGTIDWQPLVLSVSVWGVLGLVSACVLVFKSRRVATR